MTISTSDNNLLDQAEASSPGGIAGKLILKGASRLRDQAQQLDVALFGSHILIVILILGILLVSYRGPGEIAGNLTHGALDQSSPSVDQIVAANVANSVAGLTSVTVEDNVANLSITLNAKNALAQTDDTLLNKPQIISQVGRDRISKYASKDGDTVQSVASQFGVSDDTIRWANKLTSDTIGAGKTLTILGATGVLYTVKDGDTAQSLADKYKADKAYLITLNDLELSGLKTGQQIIIPDGILPENERPGYVTPRSTRTTASASQVSTLRVGIYGGNGYSYGYCTYYVYNRRAQVGRPIGGNWGNASSWAYYARADGFRVDTTPEAGAVMQSAGGWYGYGHVSVVEKVNGDGSIDVSEMNYRAWNVISSRNIPASQVKSYNYIH